MEAVIFIGIPGAGKTSFYKAQFFRTHVRISLDMLRTRHREMLLMRACVAAKQSFVVDNTSVTPAHRARIIELVQPKKFMVIGYYFPTSVMASIRRNMARPDAERVPDQAIGGLYKQLVPPTYAEGFDQLFSVELAENGFDVKPYPNDE